MKKLSILTMSSVMMAAAPIALAISCGNDKIDLEKTIIVQAEKEWKPFYEKVIIDFKTNEVNLMSENGITDIKIQEMGTFDVEANIKNKGIRDQASPDIFVVASDRFNDFKANNYLKAFSSTDADDFLSDHLVETEIATADRKFEASTSALQDIAKVNDKLYGVPENVEAMVEFYSSDVSDPSTLKSITRFSDLWMANGFFNTAEGNLRDVAWTHKTDNSAVYQSIFDENPNIPQSTLENKAEAEALIKAGFENILNIIADKNINQDAFQKDSGKAAPIVNEHVKNNTTTTSILAGPWDQATLKETTFDNKISAKAAPSTWNQWGGGYLYSMNSRVSENKAKVMEELISYFYHTKYAKEMYEVMGKLSPISAGRKELAKLDDPVTEAVYQTPIYDRPLDSAFSTINVWDAYATIIDSNKATLSSLKAAGIPSLVDTLTQGFIDNIKSGVQQANA